MAFTRAWACHGVRVLQHVILGQFNLDPATATASKNRFGSTTLVNQGKPDMTNRSAIGNRVVFLLDTNRLPRLAIVAMRFWSEVGGICEAIY
jgi:hypothetical protein